MVKNVLLVVSRTLQLTASKWAVVSRARYVVRRKWVAVRITPHHARRHLYVVCG